MRIPIPMPADAYQPPYPLPALTTYELKDYRLLLERALGDRQIGRAPIAEDLQAQLDQVMAEEEQRQRIRRGQQKGTHSV